VRRVSIVQRPFPHHVQLQRGSISGADAAPSPAFIAPELRGWRALRSPCGGRRQRPPPTGEPLEQFRAQRRRALALAHREILLRAWILPQVEQLELVALAVRAQLRFVLGVELQDQVPARLRDRGRRACAGERETRAVELELVDMGQISAGKSHFVQSREIEQRAPEVVVLHRRGAHRAGRRAGPRERERHVQRVGIHVLVCPPDAVGAEHLAMVARERDDTLPHARMSEQSREFLVLVCDLAAVQRANVVCIAHALEVRRYAHAGLGLDRERARIAGVVTRLPRRVRLVRPVRVEHVHPREHRARARLVEQPQRRIDRLRRRARRRGVERALEALPEAGIRR
jgi:hypothetical protein